MTLRRKLIWGATALLILVGGALLWTAPRQQASVAQNSARLPSPIMERAFTDAPAGLVVVSGAGSDRLLELRVTEGQRVKRGEIIAVLLNYPRDDIAVRLEEVRLEKAKLVREAMIAGMPPTKKATQQGDTGPNPGKGEKKDPGKDAPKIGIAEQEAMVKISAEQHKLKVFEMQRSSVSGEEKGLEIRVSEQKLERDRAQLRVLKETLASDLAETEADVKLKTARLESARAKRELDLVRAPIDGVVVQIWTHPGERIDRGIAQIADMSQLRIVADLDEQLLGRVTPGGKAEVVFRGEKRIHEGKIARIGSTVKRMLSMGSLGTGATNLNVVQVEVVLDDPSQMPEILGREALVTFF